jgi:hypothetical protein
VTIEQIARALGLDEKTIDRDNKSIAESFRAGGIDLASLNLAEVKFVAAVIVVELQKKCPDDSDRTDAEDVTPCAPSTFLYPASGRVSGVGARAGLRLPRRFRSKP